MERIFFSGHTVKADETSAADGRPAAEPVWNVTSRKSKVKIAVVGISRGAGATFIAISLAFLLSKNVESRKAEGDGGSGRGDVPGVSRTMERILNRHRLLPSAGKTAVPDIFCAAYVEMRQPGPGEAGAFFAAGLDQRFRGKRFTDFFGLHASVLSQRINLHKGINWAVWRDSQCLKRGLVTEHEEPEDSADPAEPAADLSHFPLDEIAGTWIVADSPPLENLHQYDLVLAVINPMPADVYAGAETYEILRDLEHSGLPIFWIVNQDNHAVNHGELRRFLKLKEYFSVPLVDSELFFQAQYACRLPVELLLKENASAADALKELAERVRRYFAEKSG